MTEYVTKDSGERQSYESGMVRDTQKGKPRFDLFLASGIPFEEQFFTRVAALAQRGADKYGERNHELASSPEELARFRASAMRHLLQWMCHEQDEDHASAVAYNLFMAESCRWRLENS